MVEKNAEPKTQKERQSYLLKRLILDDEGLELYDLEDALFLNSTSLRQEFTRMKKLLESYHLKLTSSNHTYRVEGSEKQKRRAMSALMMEEASKGMLLSHALWEDFSEEEEKKIRGILKKDLEESRLYVNDFAFLNLCVHLLIMIERNRSGKLLQMSQIPDREASERIKAFVRALFQDLEEEFGQSFQYWEKQDFMFLVESQTQPLEQEGRMDEIWRLLDEQGCALLEDILERVRREYYIDLKDNPFLARFALHLKNLLMRIERGSACHNPYAEYIKLSCPMFYEVSVCIADSIFEYSGCYINDDEIAFLALHLGTMFDLKRQAEKLRVVLVCPGYHDLADRMKRQIEERFGGELYLLRPVGNEEQLNEIDRECDLILSTISFHGHYEQEVVYVTPLLTEADIRHIQVAVRNFQIKRERESAGELFHSTFNEALFCFWEEEASQEQILRQMCARMEEQGYVDASYYERVKSREQLSPTVYGRVAIPHSLKACAFQSGICVFICDKPVVWSGRQVSIVLMLAIHPEEQRRFNEMWDRITKIFSNDDAIARMMRCRTYREFMEVLAAGVD